jgi:glutamate-ammonia-ligase adenylyltransferase
LINVAIENIVRERSWTEEDNELAMSTRKQLETTANVRNIKRGVGGTMDVEYIAQLLMLRNVFSHPEIFVAGTLEAIERLRVAGLIHPKDADALKDGYNFLRGVESGLRLMNTQARYDLPTSESELSRLAYVLNLTSGDELMRQCEQFRQSHRRLFEKYLGQPAI